MNSANRPVRRAEAEICSAHSLSDVVMPADDAHRAGLQSFVA